MGWIIKDLWQDAGAHLKGIATWVDTRRPGQGSDFLADEYRAQTRRAVESIHPERMRLRVVEVADRTPTIRSFRLVREDGELPPFRPGQYVNLWVDIDGVRTHRPYSICSIPGDEHLELSVKDVPGGFVAPHLRRTLKVGDPLDSSGPGGNFVHEPLSDGLDLVLLAGGCGLTPFLSIVRQASRDGWPARIHLIHGCTTPEEAMEAEELVGLTDATDRFHYDRVYSAAPGAGRSGLLDARCIGELVGEVGGKTFFTCGPLPMIELCRSALGELGVEEHRVRFELPGTPPDVTAVRGWPGGIEPTDSFELRVGERVVQATAGEPLLCTLERHGLLIPGRCRSGECAACRTQLASGQVYELPTAHVRESDRHYGYIHPCASYPISDLELRW
jgi:ferredoxin-NADP reductase